MVIWKIKANFSQKPLYELKSFFRLKKCENSPKTHTQILVTFFSFQLHSPMERVDISLLFFSMSLSSLKGWFKKKNCNLPLLYNGWTRNPFLWNGWNLFFLLFQPPLLKLGEEGKLFHFSYNFPLLWNGIPNILQIKLIVKFNDLA